MIFGAPRLLGFLVVVPALVAWYVHAARRRARRAEALAAQGLVAMAGPTRRPRRHLPFAMFVVAITVLLVALARPATTVRTPRQQGTVIVALDVSTSMRATDVKPSRITAAQKAARDFVDRQAAAVKVGVVAFGDGAVVVQAPTRNRADVRAAIDRVSVGGGTSVGQGLLTALDTIAGKTITIDPDALQSDSGSVDVGYYGGTAVVVVSDGENMSDLDPVAVAKVASVAGIRVHAIGVGTEAGTVVRVNGFDIATALNRPLLEQLASSTDGTYHAATDRSAPAAIARTIRLHFTIAGHHTEVTALFSAVAAALMLAGALVSLRSYGRVV